MKTEIFHRFCSPRGRCLSQWRLVPLLSWKKINKSKAPPSPSRLGHASFQSGAGRGGRGNSSVPDQIPPHPKLFFTFFHPSHPFFSFSLFDNYFLWMLLRFIIIIIVWETFQDRRFCFVTAYLTYQNIFIGDHMHFLLILFFVFIWIMSNRIYFLFMLNYDLPY